MLQEFTLSRVLMEQLSEAAEAADISVERFVALAIAEKLARFEYSMWLADQGLASALPKAQFLSKLRPNLEG